MGNCFCHLHLIERVGLLAIIQIKAGRLKGKSVMEGLRHGK